jgi:hypothetical protein
MQSFYKEIEKKKSKTIIGVSREDIINITDKII